MKFRPAIYARYSSDLQRAASIEDQRRRCEAEAQRRGFPPPRLFSDSEIAGSVAQARPGYQALLAAARAGEINLIIVDELSRLTRDPEELARLRKRLRFWRCDLIALLDGVDTLNAPQAASAVMLLGAYRAETETEAIAHRTRRGLEGRVRARMHAGGAIYGYRTRAVHADRPGDPPGTGPVIGYEYVIHEEEAETIRQIFTWYAEGNSPRTIAAALNELGVPAPAARWRNRTGRRGTWSHTALYGSADGRTGILNNERYIGRLTWNRTSRPRDPERDGKKALRLNDPADWVIVDAPELRIVPQELWDRVKARQQVRSAGSNGSRATRTMRLLSGLLRCQNCGGALRIQGGVTYRCGTHYDRGDTVCDSRASVPAHRAEAAVLNFLSHLFSSERMLELTLQKLRERQRAVIPRRDPDALSRQIAEAEAEAARLVEAIGRGVLVAQLEARMRQAEARLRSLRALQQQREEQETGVGVITPLPSAARRLMMNLRQALEAGEAEGLRAVLGQLVERIEVQARPRVGRVRPAITLALALKGGMAALLGLPNLTIGGAQDWI